MSVQSLAFLAFLTVTVCVCRLLPKERTWVLLAASLVFYLWGGAPAALWGCGLLAVSSFVSYLAANTLRKHRRKSVLLAVVCYHIAVLGIFKYTGFFTGGAVRMPFVPLGISFFTFQQIWYLREVYAGTFSQVPTPAEYLTYSFFFPTVSSGPILKPGNFFPQLREASPLPQDTAAGLYAIGLGLAKKVLIANQVGALWEQISAMSAPTAVTAWLGAIAFTFQIYFDFSGYSDMAIGLGRIFGFRFSENFNYPYISKSVTEFWRRWHISLSTWFRDYLYFPLGGSRNGNARTVLSLTVVWFFTGLWHGASWNFVLWGVMLLGFILLEKFCIGDFLKEHKVLSHVYLLFVIPQTWVIFRITRLKDVGAYFSRLFPLFGAHSAISAQDALKLLSSYWWLLLLAVLAIFFCLPQPRRFYEKHRGSLLVQLPLFLLFWVCVYFIATSSGNAFLYSRF